MNYEELRKANELVDELHNINWVIKTIEREKHVHMHCFNYKVILFDEQMEKVLDILKEIRDEMVKELNELGVTEEE
ncbi:hypothetical protein PNO24_00440 [Gemella haemolysans]|uniref:hypothetical protein n=1 Tax=Gemella haemolysans TaxID=1379 RepID=UPI00232DE8D4|nr:hypothetical protein [Gemella haemolysans]MDB6212394.1 hypothetical protein [Gemella haemolysans]